MSFVPVLSYKYSCMLRAAKKKRASSKIFIFLFLPSPLPVCFQPVAVMEALEGGSSSASTSRSTKRNGMKRNETRREPRQHLFPTIREVPLRSFFISSLLRPCLLVCFLICSRKECKSACTRVLSFSYLFSLLK